MNREALEALRSVPKIKNVPYVFHRKGRRVKDFRTRWLSTVQRAGLGDLHFHDLRHTFTTWLAELGYDVRTIMELTDHSDPQMVLRYTKPQKKYLRAAVDELAAKAGASLGNDEGEGGNPVGGAHQPGMEVGTKGSPKDGEQQVSTGV